MDTDSKSQDRSKDKKDKKDKKQKKHKQKDNQDQASPATSTPTKTKKKDVTLLVVDSDDKDWYKMFEGAELKDGRRIIVEKTRWEHMILSSDGNNCIINIKPNTVRWMPSGSVCERVLTCAAPRFWYRNHCPTHERVASEQSRQTLFS
jgi:hypothetical protein